MKGKTELCDKNGFNQVSIYCQDPEMIKFLKDCTNEVRDSGTYQKRHLIVSVQLWNFLFGRSKLIDFSSNCNICDKLHSDGATVIANCKCL